MSSEHNADIKAQAGAEPAIRVVNVAKHYQIYTQPSDRLKQFVIPRLQRVLGRPVHNYGHEFRALDGVTFEVKRGETLGIIGRNGSGKSTLLQMICGTLTPTQGEISTNGRVAALLELGAGFDPEFSGRENIYMNAALMGLTKAQTDERLEDILAFADIGEFVDQPVKTYSSGMFVRLAFAVIAHVDADILVIDEALSVGDAFFVQKCMRFLREFMKRGTVLFVSHDTSAVLGLCKRAIWLEGGKIAQEGSPKDVTNAYLKAFFEGNQGASAETVEAGTVGEDTNVLGDEPLIVEVARDMRQDIINASPYRNDLELFEFDPSGGGFGKGGAMFENIVLQDPQGRRLNWVVGGEEVVLRITARVQEGHTLTRPIIGFYIKDRLGQNLFGDNTFLMYQNSPVKAEAGSLLTASFLFRMPVMPAGDYTIGAAIADGTQHDHVHHHWLHDAVHFKSHSSSHSHGMIGIPMHDIRLDVGS